MDLDIKLSPSFSLREFVISQVAERKGIINIPSEDVINNLKRLCVTILEPARAKLGGLRISSGYRSIKLNKAVGGAVTSGHIFGFCADILPLKVSNIDFAKWVVKNVPFDQVILEFGTKSNPAWIHVSSDPRNRKQVLQILKGSSYLPVQL